MNIIEVYKKLIEYKVILGDRCTLSNFRAALSLAYCYIMHGASPTSWFMFDMYKLNNRARKNIITAKRNDKLDCLFNPRRYREIYDNKALFNKNFASFVKRDWLYLKEASQDELEDFFKRHDEFVVKPVGLSSGRGVHLATKEEFATEGHIVGISDILVEERVIVHPDLQKLNPDSCNTIRVYTLVDKDSNISIIGSYLKVGGGNGICDNFHNKGIMYCVDPKYGVITHPGLDFALRNHVIHPNTEYIMPGRQIPMWNEVLDCAIKAQKQNMKSRFIAWDIAITDNGCEIIEGNYNPNCNLLQIFDKEGKYHEILSRY